METKYYVQHWIAHYDKWSEVPFSKFDTMEEARQDAEAFFYPHIRWRIVKCTTEIVYEVNANDK